MLKPMTWQNFGFTRKVKTVSTGGGGATQDLHKTKSLKASGWNLVSKYIWVACI